MPGGTILESLTKSNGVLDKITKRLDILKNLFENTPVVLIAPQEDGFVLANSIEAHTIYNNGNSSITTGMWKKAGDLWPEHSHKESIEYLIVESGKFMVRIGDIPRVVYKGECVSMQIGVRHSVTALEDNSSMLGICVPPERAYCLEGKNV